MKKNLLLISLLVIWMSGFSQSTLFTEYFNDGVVPAAWGNIDQDGDSLTWYADTWDNPGGFTESYLVSESYNKNHVPKALTPENYLVSPKINLTGLDGTVSLRYVIQVGDEDYPAEHYKVAVSTTGNQVADFTNIVKDETCTAAEYYDTSPYWHERVLDLTPFIGHEIYLTWCHFDCTDQYRFYLDSVQVSYTPTPKPTVLFAEYFDGGVMPAAWGNIDQDGDSLTWYADTWDNPGGFTESYLVSESYNKNHVPKALTPENYLISPQIDLTGLDGTVSLRFVLQVGDEDYPAEHYKVAVSTTGNQVADFTNIVKDETCTAADFYDNSPYWHERVVDLTSFIGQKIYLTWVHFDCTDQYRFYIDSIQVTNTPGANVGLSKLPLANVLTYPNPVKDKLMVTGAFENAKIQMFTADGRQVYRSEMVTRQTTINVSAFKKGMYLLKIETKDGTVTRKISITN